MSFVISSGIIQTPLTAGGVAYGTGSAAKINAAGTANQVLQSNGASAPSWVTLSVSGGTVSSVAATVPSIFSISGSPITTSGTLAMTYSGTALPVANGGTGQTSLSAVTVGTSTNLAGGSNGTIPYQSASGTTQMLAAGTSGQILQTNGVAAPTWINNGLTLISTITATGASANFTGLSGYNNYLILFNAVIAASATAGIFFTLGTGATPTYLTSNLYYNQVFTILSGSYGLGYTVNNYNLSQGNSGSFRVTDNQETGMGASGFIIMSNFNNSKNFSFNSKMQYLVPGTNLLGYSETYGFIPSNTTTKTAIKFFTDGSGNLSSGTISLYGISS